VLGSPDAAGAITDDVAALVKLILQRRGYEVHVAADLDQATNLLKFIEWDLLIATSLGYWGGIEIFQRPPKQVHRLALSADPLLHKAGDPTAAEVFIKKPFAPDELIVAVDSMLGQARRR
jgi:DNA-binding response OmpR family regulator